jgi:hypothetical protein
MLAESFVDNPVAFGGRERAAEVVLVGFFEEPFGVLAFERGFFILFAKSS